MGKNWLKVAETVKRERNRLKLTQKQLAKRANLGTSTIGEIEGGRVREDRRPDTLSKISEALGKPKGFLDAIRDGVEPPAPATISQNVDQAPQFDMRIKRLELLVEGIKSDTETIKQRQQADGEKLDSIGDALTRFSD